jgi:REP element-mobilizing transposase RayT
MPYWRLFYHFVWTTKNREPLLTPEMELRVHGFLRNEAEKMQAPLCFVNGMPDHVHVFVRVGAAGRVGLAVKCLRESITKKLHIQSPVTRVWQPGFFDHVLRSAESYMEKWAYVRQNPVRAGLCNDAEEWPYQGESVIIQF